MEDRESAFFLASKTHSTTEHQKLSFQKSDVLEVDFASNDIFDPESWYQARNCRTNLTGYVHGNLYQNVYWHWVYNLKIIINRAIYFACAGHNLKPYNVEAEFIDPVINKPSLETEDIYVQCSNQVSDIAGSPAGPPYEYHVLVEVFFVTPILCLYCKDYIWGSGKQGSQCKSKVYSNILFYKIFDKLILLYSMSVMFS